MGKKENGELRAALEGAMDARLLGDGEFSAVVDLLEEQSGKAFAELKSAFETQQMARAAGEGLRSLFGAGMEVEWDDGQTLSGTEGRAGELVELLSEAFGQTLHEIEEHLLPLQRDLGVEPGKGAEAFRKCFLEMMPEQLRQAVVSKMESAAVGAHAAKPAEGPKKAKKAGI